MQMVFEAKNDKFTAEGLRCRQDLKYENFTWSFGRRHIPNRTFLVRFGDISGEFGWAMVRITHGETKRAWYASEPYQKGTIRYLPYPNSPQNLALR